MKWVLGLLFLFFGCASKPCQHGPKTLRCVQYVSNYDGDTIKVNVKDLHPLFGQKISVRVLGVDTPEIKGKGRCEKAAAKKAKTFVAQILQNAQNIELRKIQRDKYFRIGAEVWADGKNIGPALIQSKLAVPYDGGRKPASSWCS